ncbi:mechanosensitive ion channel domain-containing protein [Aliihoeflea sp. 40Bstr573]|jgi:small-conductance mechanosensitive channel|uniref:mechanosensitive ion channel domain-containing protein n=1 Tax=Aliihoeflea sp. 40Bstr573 TaxID=2696467 RepID=UPI002094B83B|nr:mechanosensitive ion channel domain-containing protein [Aliihoeflea sp. 40Bstr573]MCO6389256.1 mechanosensitive ion channel [Aliihoeflea sp. 40Bstr573]
MTFDLSSWNVPLALGAASPDLVASALLILVLWIARTILVKLIRMRTSLPPHVLRRWIATSRNVLLFLLLLGLVLIWAPQLRTFALSLAAVAVALVVATKEMILCVSGSLMRSSTRAFTVGDWIEVYGVRGEVVDHTLLATTIQEFQPSSFHYTGRTAVLPNSVFFTSPIRNLSVLRDYTFHSFAVTAEPDVDLLDRDAEIATIVDRHYGAHREEAARVNARIERRSGVDILEPDSRIRFSTTDLGKQRVTVSLFCPTRQADVLEDAITREIMTLIRFAEKQGSSADRS